MGERGLCQVRGAWTPPEGCCGLPKGVRSASCEHIPRRFTHSIKISFLSHFLVSWHSSFGPRSPPSAPTDMARKKLSKSKRDTRSSSMFPLLHQDVSDAVSDAITSSWFNTTNNDKDSCSKYPTYVVGKSQCDNDACSMDAGVARRCRCWLRVSQERVQRPASPATDSAFWHSTTAPMLIELYTGSRNGQAFRNLSFGLSLRNPSWIRRWSSNRFLLPRLHLDRLANQTISLLCI